MQIFNEEAFSLVPIVAEKEEIEIDHIVKKATLNTITKASLGKELLDFKTENTATDESLISLVENGKEIAITRILNPLLLFEPLFRRRTRQKYCLDAYNQRDSRRQLRGNIKSNQF
ncbi:unnamed protein product [Orchesella dallaii]|uniref:Uncharacterized protein n=1 Tax=Orchesella dallaii TaxID=48710 RepID=A0ABP1Q2R5_9HEXA